MIIEERIILNERKDVIEMFKDDLSQQSIHLSGDMADVVYISSPFNLPVSISRFNSKSYVSESYVQNNFIQNLNEYSGTTFWEALYITSLYHTFDRLPNLRNERKRIIELNNFEYTNKPYFDYYEIGIDSILSNMHGMLIFPFQMEQIIMLLTGFNELNIKPISRKNDSGVLGFHSMISDWTHLLIKVPYLIEGLNNESWKRTLKGSLWLPNFKGAQNLMFYLKSKNNHFKF